MATHAEGDSYTRTNPPPTKTIPMDDNNPNYNNKTTDGIMDIRDENLASIEIAVQSIILVVAIISNSFVFAALCCQRRFRPTSRMYLFMLHLSVADLLVAFLSLLPQLIWDVTFRFQGSDILCRVVKYLQVMVLYLSTYILVMMAVDRCRAVCWSITGHWNSLRAAKLMIVGAWVLAFLAAIPQAIIFGKMEIRPGVHDCWAHFEQPWGEKAYVTWFVLSIFIIPLIVIAASYGFICYTLWIYDEEHGRSGDVIALRAVGNGTGGGDTVTDSCRLYSRRVAGVSNPNPISEAKVKTLKLTFLVVVCFFVCWSPFCITQLVLTFNPPSPDAQIGSVEVILLLLASLNSCTNPWIYVAFSGSLLNQLRMCLGLGLTRPKDIASIGDEEPQPQQQQPTNKLPSTKSEMV
uniref:G-protein coupled receptors family 1 profile domain-containing protein n=1 Tax=Strigamia maritima TaxID=126957 RepID=T1J5K6_STRMM